MFMCNYCLCIVLWIFQACQPRWNDPLGAGGVATWRCWWSASSGFCRTTTRLFCLDKVWTQKWAVFETLVGWWLSGILWNYTTQYTGDCWWLYGIILPFTSRELSYSNRWIQCIRPRCYFSTSFFTSFTWDRRDKNGGVCISFHRQQKDLGLLQRYLLLGPKEVQEQHRISVASWTCLLPSNWRSRTTWRQDFSDIQRTLSHSLFEKVLGLWI